ncbi:hypothetical protein ACFSLT_00995 [Novosphingobium resinovorum]
MVRSRYLWWLTAALVCAVAVAFLTGLAVRQAGTTRFAAQAAVDARLRQALLASEIARFRLLRWRWQTIRTSSRSSPVVREPKP